MQIFERDAQSPNATIREISGALEAVCDELGIARFERARRATVARRIEAVWRAGRTQPLDLVDAGLGTFG